jgi:DNA-directed RNA polymerase subunit RPC12/RpoP
MAHAKDKANARKGIPLDNEETLRELDPARIATAKNPEAMEVVGQDAEYGDWVQCPYCGYVWWARGLHTDYYIAVRCPACQQIVLA